MLESLCEVLPWSVWPEGRDKIGIVDEAEANKVWVLACDGRGERFPSLFIHESQIPDIELFYYEQLHDNVFEFW